MQTVLGTMRYGGYIRNAGWNRWSCETSDRWTDGSTLIVSIPRYQRFPLRIAP